MSLGDLVLSHILLCNLVCRSVPCITLRKTPRHEHYALVMRRTILEFFLGSYIKNAVAVVGYIFTKSKIYVACKVCVHLAVVHEYVRPSGEGERVKHVFCIQKRYYYGWIMEVVCLADKKDTRHK